MNSFSPLNYLKIKQKNMIKLLAVTVALVAFNIVGATTLQEKLLKINGVVSVEQLEKGSFLERYVVTFTQPLDHKNLKKGTFEQRVVVAHAGEERPTLLVTEGYGGARALSPRYREEISTKLNTNQIFVEHRFFGESTPSPCNWDFLTGENAAGDLHAVREALREIYPAKWVASGVSKGGQNTMIYASFYPDNVDVYVPYVGPVCFGVEDGRHEPFLENVGSEGEREVILNFQKEVLKRRQELMPLFREYCEGKGYKFQIPIEEVFDYTVLEYPFSIWQWGTAVSTIPPVDGSHQELFDHLVAIVGPDYLAISDEPSFFVQAARELGYYGYDTKPFDGLLAIKDARGYLKKVFLPKDAQNIKFSKNLANKITDYLLKNDPKMIFIYGEIDPWSAAMPLAKVFDGKKNMQLVIEKRGSHRARINSLPEAERDAVWALLAGWLK